MGQAWEEGKCRADEEKSIGLHRFRFHAPHRITMVIRAGSYLKADFVTFPVEFMRDEAEAVAWFASLEK